jgi:uncharacterized membrane protein
VEELLVTAVGYLKLAVEAVGAAIVGFGALATVVVYLLSVFGIRKRSYTEIRLFLGRYLALGLEFQLGSDILSTAVAPTIAEVEILAAIVVIRTVLNYFLSREIERERGSSPKSSVVSSKKRPPSSLHERHLLAVVPFAATFP